MSIHLLVHLRRLLLLSLSLGIRGILLPSTILVGRLLRRGRLAWLSASTCSLTHVPSLLRIHVDQSKRTCPQAEGGLGESES